MKTRFKKLISESGVWTNEDKYPLETEVQRLNLSAIVHCRLLWTNLDSCENKFSFIADFFPSSW